MKFAICNETWGDLPFARACDDAAAAGYDGIEIALSAIDSDPRRIDERRAAELGAVARRAGLEVVGLHWLLARPSGMHLCTPDDLVRRRTGDYLCHLARLCAAMEGAVMVLGSPKQRDVVDTRERSFERAAAVCRRVAEVAEPLGVTLCLEPLAPAYTDFLTTAAEAVALIEAVDHPGCRLHLDAFAMTSEDESPAAIIAAQGRHLAHFHANDTSLGGPGTGTIDFPAIAGALGQVGYDRWVSVEVFDFEPGPDVIARESIAFLRQVFGSEPD